MDLPGVSWMVLAPVLAGLALLAYPTLWYRRLCADGLGSAEAWSLRAPLLLAATFVVAIVPASLIGKGWVVLPTSVALISFAYISVFVSVARARPEEMRPSLKTLLGFLVQMLGLAVLMIWGAWSEYTRSFHAGGAGFVIMRDVAMINFLSLGVVPPIVASVGIALRWFGIPVAEAEEA